MPNIVDANFLHTPSATWICKAPLAAVSHYARESNGEQAMADQLGIADVGGGPSSKNFWPQVPTGLSTEGDDERPLE